jgi:hypothetical protein
VDRFDQGRYCVDYFFLRQPELARRACRVDPKAWLMATTAPPVTWHKQEFRTALTYGEAGLVVGYVSGDKLWGITKVTATWPTDDPHTDIFETRWRITHLPTGLAIRDGHKTLREAKAICTRLSQRPNLWQAGTFGIVPVWSKRERKIRTNLLDKAIASTTGAS